MREPRKNVRRCCLVLVTVAALALPGASWLSETSNGDTASWVSGAAPEN
jgi:hypothetical protein